MARHLPNAVLLLLALLLASIGLSEALTQRPSSFVPVSAPGFVVVERNGTISIGDIQVLVGQEGRAPSAWAFSSDVDANGTPGVGVRVYSIPGLQGLEAGFFPVPGGVGISRAVPADLDHDAIDELILVGATATPIEGFVAVLGQTPLRLRSFDVVARPYFTSRLTDAISVDLDGDGWVEIVAAGNTGGDNGTISFLEIYGHAAGNGPPWTGAPVFIQRIENSLPGGQSAVVSSGDVDADGRAELCWAYARNSGAFDQTYIEVLQMDGFNATLASFGALQYGDGNPFDMLLLQGDEDEASEIYLATDAGWLGEIGLTRWQVNGDFVSQDRLLSLRSEQGYAHRVLAWDFDVDGRPELIVSSTTVNASTNGTIAIATLDLTLLNSFSDEELGDRIVLATTPVVVGGSVYLIGGGSEGGRGYLAVWTFPGRPTPPVLAIPWALTLAGTSGVLAGRRRLTGGLVPVGAALYAKLSPKAALRHATRQKILDVVSKEGPLTEAMICQVLSANRSTVRWHIELLVKTGHLGRYELPLDGSRGFYALPDKPPRLEDVQGITRVRVLAAVPASGTTAREVASATGISLRLARYHLQELCENGWVAKDGRRYRTISRPGDDARGNRSSAGTSLGENAGLNG